MTAEHEKSSLITCTKKLPWREKLTDQFKGVTIAAWTKDGFDKIDVKGLKPLGVNCVSISMTWYQDHPSSPDMFPTESTPSDSSLVSLIRRIRDQGIDVMLKPHIDLVNPEEGWWRGIIDPKDWEAWSKNYTNFILHYASISQSTGAGMLCIGTELLSIALRRPEFWKALAGEVKKKFDGKVLYAANWYGEYPYIEVWDPLDYAGVNAFFPLTTDPKPTRTALMKSWIRWVDQLEKWQAKINKPVIFTEAGYKSCFGTAVRPWEWHPTEEEEEDPVLQADCYDALLEVFWNKPWFRGVFWWYWDAFPRLDTKRDFGCRDKLAEKILSKWYKNER